MLSEGVSLFIHVCLYLYTEGIRSYGAGVLLLLRAASVSVPEIAILLDFVSAVSG